MLKFFVWAAMHHPHCIRFKLPIDIEIEGCPFGRGGIQINIWRTAWVEYSCDTLRDYWAAHPGIDWTLPF